MLYVSYATLLRELHKSSILLSLLLLSEEKNSTNKNLRNAKNNPLIILGLYYYTTILVEMISRTFELKGGIQPKINQNIGKINMKIVILN